ncbi:TetR/AcrR family transcriptional regulator [Chitinibacter bivalviorum]|uniref:TetR/AcrR family transcriptional regulator n=1 Tax=Chitinibacter bivalviorum TaxID=2739434 RepID=A0A7H9BHR3_9NEIS|nr:TetR/AcrR family transcriptional regulator [Chitinibacter bivalviorum]QLG87872.1 TetR/AcrR family transcriptional regulator [Chitinibacter bivalviorum]
MESVKSPDTATRILNAAEVLFIEHGFAGTSMRQITAAAAVNIAAVNYYFGSKDGLFQAVFERRAEPFARLSLAKLTELEAAQPAADAMAIAKSFIAAALEMGRNPEYGGLVFVRLLARSYVEPNSILKEKIPQRYGELTRRYQAALERALPHLSAAEVAWRFHFMTSAMFNAFAGNHVLRLFMAQPMVNSRDPQLVADMLLPFIAAGLASPAAVIA